GSRVGGAVRSFHGEPAVGRRVGREHLIPRSFLDEMPAQARWRYVGEIKRLHDVYSVDGPFAKGNPAVREQVDYVISEPPFAEPYDEESVELRTLPSAARRSVPLWRRSSCSACSPPTTLRTMRRSGVRICGSSTPRGSIGKPAGIVGGWR